MALSLAQSLIEIRYILNEATASFWSDAELTAYLKEGCRIFSSKSLLVTNIGTISPMILTTPYYDSGDETFISNILEIYSVIYNIGTSYKGLVQIHPRQIGNLAKSAVTGPPKYYCLFGKKLYIFPLASAVEVAGGTLDILYSGRTDDITVIDDEYQHLPIIYAIAKALQKDKQFNQASLYMQQFFEEIAFERSDKYQRGEDTIQDFKLKGTNQAMGTTNARR